MNHPEVTYNTLPAAVQRLQEQLDRIERKLEVVSSLQDQKEPDEFIGVEETARLLGVVKATMYNKVSARKIPTYKYGRKLKFKRSEVLGLLHDSRIMTASEEQELIQKEAEELLRHSVSRRRGK